MAYRAKILTKRFDPRRLRPGLYVAASDTPAWGSLQAAIELGHAIPQGQNLGYRGLEAIAASVGNVRAVARKTKIRGGRGAQRNPAIVGGFEDDGEWEEGEAILTDDWFTNAVRTYKAWKTNWWREVIQNSVDAGATKILCEVVENDDGSFLIACQDNGKGMSRKTLEENFLNFGGTTKLSDTGSVGGFGMAKQLILYPWITWSIHTRDYYAKYRDGAYKHQYRIKKVPQRMDGTRVEVTMPGDLHTTDVYMSTFIHKCYLPKVEFEVFTSLLLPDDEGVKRRVDKTRTLQALLGGGERIAEVAGVADLYKIHVDYDATKVFVRTKGVYMFSRSFYLGYGVVNNFQVYAELTAPSVEILSDNRDDFRNDPGKDYSQADSELGRFIADIIKDVKKTLRIEAKKIRVKYRGRGQAFRADQRRFRSLMYSAIGPIPPTTDGSLSLAKTQVKAVTEVLKEEAQRDKRELTRGRVTRSVPDAAMAKIMLEQEITGPNHVENVIAQLAWEPPFYLVNDIPMFDIHKKFWPQTMSKRVSKLARVWGHLCSFVLAQLNSDKEFGIGFIFSNEAAAEAREEPPEEPGIPWGWLMLNPFADLATRKKIWNLSDRDHQRWLYAAAIHECTHLADNVWEHYDDFAVALTRNIAKTAGGFSKVRDIVRSTKTAEAGLAVGPQVEANPRRPRRPTRRRASAKRSDVRRIVYESLK